MIYERIVINIKQRILRLFSVFINDIKLAKLKYLETFLKKGFRVFLSIPKIFKDRINVPYEYKKQKFDFLWFKINANNDFYRIKKTLLGDIFSRVNKLEVRLDKKTSIINCMENFETQINIFIKLYIDDNISHMDNIMYTRVTETENENYEN